MIAPSRESHTAFAARPPVLIAVAVGLAAAEIQAHGLASAAPEMLRLAVSFVALIVLPGLAWAALGVGPGPPRVLGLLPACGFGIAWNAVLILALRAFGRPFTDMLWLSPILTLALWGLAVWRGRGSGRRGEAVGSALRGPALAAVLVAASLASLHAGRVGATLAYFSDSPDHVGTIRRMIETGDAFPNNAFFRDAGREGADPRKGLWHPQVGLIATQARVDPADAWRQLPALIAPLFILNLAALGFLAFGPRGAAFFAWAQLIVSAGSLRWFPLAKAVFATFLADQLCVGVVILALLDLERPSRKARVGAIVLAFAAVTTHVYSAIQLAMTLGALIAVQLIAERRLRGGVARLAGTAALAGLFALPYLAWRARQSYAPANEIHTESQGLMVLAGHWRVVSAGVMWDWMEKLWILFPLAWIPLARRLRRDPAARYVFATSVVVALVIFDPFAVDLLEPRLGYLLMRMIWMVPIGALVGWLALRLFDAARGNGNPDATAAGRTHRGLAAVGLVLLGWFLTPTARDALSTWVVPARYADADRQQSPMRWRAAMRWLDRELPRGQVILSDPITSYGVPMLTHHYVATLVDQHSSPSDGRALRRILDARDALDPYSSWELTRALIRRHGVTAIIINSDFAVPPRLDYWTPTAGWAAAARERLDHEPGAFERLYDHDGFTVYRVHDAALDSLSAPVPLRPQVVPYESGRFPIGRRFAEDLPVIHRLALSSSRVVRGDTLQAVADWRALGPMRPGSYIVSVRFDRPLPGDFSPPAMIAKPARKLIESFRHQLYRFRDDHVPTSGVYGVDLWKPGEIVLDSFRVAVPARAAPGYYRVEIRMHRSPHYPNFRLSDYFFDRDYYSGVPMGFIEVVDSRADLARSPARLPESMESGH